MKKLPILLLLLTAFITKAGNEFHSTGARGWAMGNASAALTDVFAANNNQAGLANLKNISIGIYSERKFLLNTLNTHACIFAMPTKMGVFGISVTYFGFKDYNDKKIGLAFAKMLAENFSLGVQLDYLSTFITEYGTKSFVTFELGIQSKITRELSLGVHVYNPIRAKISSYQNEKTPTIMRLGFSYVPSEKLLLCIEVEKDIDHKPVFKTGIEYELINKLFLRAGIATNPTYNTFGIGIDLKNIKIDFASSIHTVLGYTPHLSIIHEFNK